MSFRYRLTFDDSWEVSFDEDTVEELEEALKQAGLPKCQIGSMIEQFKEAASAYKGNTTSIWERGRLKDNKRYLGQLDTHTSTVISLLTDHRAATLLNFSSDLSNILKPALRELRSHIQNSKARQDKFRANVPRGFHRLYLADTLRSKLLHSGVHCSTSKDNTLSVCLGIVLNAIGIGKRLEDPSNIIRSLPPPSESELQAFDQARRRTGKTTAQRLIVSTP